MLDVAIDCALGKICEIYDVLNLCINWKAGKSEAFLVYRGKGAAKRLATRRPAPGKPPVVRVHAAALDLVVVSSYKHLGGDIAAVGGATALARHHRNSAMAAYGPLATKIFGAPQLPRELRRRLFVSLVLSRLLFNVHIVTPTRKLVSALNDVYMRGLRRLYDQCRYGHCDSDRAFREVVREPSLDCVMSRARL